MNAWDGTVERFDTTTGDRTLVLDGQVADLFVRPVVSPGGRLLGSTDRASGRAVVRDLETLQPIVEYPPCTNPMAFSPDASLVLLDGRAICTSDMGRVPLFQPPPEAELRGRVVNVVNGAEILDLGEDIVYGVFSPDSRYLATGRFTATGGAVELYDLMTPVLVSSRTFSEAPFALAFDPHTRWLAGGTADGMVGVLDLAAVVSGTRLEEAVVFERAAHDGGVVALDMSADGVLVSAARGESVVRLSDIATGERLLELSAERSPEAYSIAEFGPDDSYVMYLDGTTIRRYDRDTEVLVELARDRLTRGFTEDECREYLGSSQLLVTSRQSACAERARSGPRSRQFRVDSPLV